MNGTITEIIGPVVDIHFAEGRPAIQDALVFVSRCQNLESEHNTTQWPAKNPDGGFYYTPLAGKGPDAEKTENGGLPSYGSMTYTGLKSMIFAGVGPDDPVDVHGGIPRRGEREVHR